MLKNKISSSRKGDSGMTRRLSKVSRILAWSRRFYSLIFFVLAIVTCLFFRGSNVIQGDGIGYYAYLPSFVIFQDPSFSEVGKINEAHPGWQRRVLPGGIPGRYSIIYPIGAAVMGLPFFLIADAATLVTGSVRDGYSIFYQYGMAIAGIFYFSAGLELLRRILLRLFSPIVTLCTLISITFGTSLFNSATYETSYSHPYSFFLFCAIVYVLQKAIPQLTLGRSIQLGLLCGLLVLVRNMNVILGVYIASFVVLSFPSFAEFKRFAISNAWNILISFIVAVIVVIPQLLMWKYSMGSYIVYSYGPYGFDFLSPHITDSLFSIRKGLFFWAPVLLLSMVGILQMSRMASRYGVSIGLFMVINIYLIGSWSCWWLGSCFGNRAFIDSYVLFAIPMAFFYASLKTRVSRWLIGILAAGFIAFTMAATLGYSMGLVPSDNASRYSFIRLFSAYGITPTPTYMLESQLNFIPEHCESYLGRGFYAPRERGVWSKSLSSSLRLKLREIPDKDLRLHIKGEALPLPAEEVNSLIIKVNGIFVGSREIARNDSTLDLVLDLPKSVIGSQRVMRIEFAVSKLIPIADVFPESEEAKDKLVVGFCLESLRISAL
jgi:hypothetical protein